MKKTYQKPTTEILGMEEMNLLANTTLPTGNSYKEGDPVLSRNSFWNDEEIAEEDF